MSTTTSWLVKSIIIFIFFLAGCGESPNDPADNNNNNNNPHTNVPDILVGEWQTNNFSSINFYNPSTGGWGAPSGTGMFFKFTTDGYYEKGLLMQSTLYKHTMTVFRYSKGTMTVKDSIITLNPTYAKIKSIDNMIPEYNYDRDDELVTEVIIWVKGIDEYNQETLYLRYTDSDFSAFHKP